MMNKLTESLERNRLLSAAREYEDKGYKVVVEPGKTDRPNFLASFQPDMIAYGDRENVVVEVKSRSTLAKSKYMEALASIVNSQSGWRFELIVVNPDTPSLAGEDSQTLSDREILSLMHEVAHLVKNRHDKAAFLLAWSATEAALRQIAINRGITLERESPIYTIKQLYSLGALDRSDYELLQRALSVRNSVVHGFSSPDFDKELVTLLIDRVQELLKGK